MDKNTDIELTHTMSGDGLTLFSRGETATREMVISVKWSTPEKVADNLERTKASNEQVIREKLSRETLESGVGSVKYINLGPLSLEVFRGSAHYSEGSIVLGPVKLTRRGLRRSASSQPGIRVGIGTRRRAFGLRLDRRRSAQPSAASKVQEKNLEEFTPSKEVPRPSLPINSYDELLPVFENPLSVGDPLSIPAGTMIFDENGATTEAARKRHVKVSKRTDGYYALEDPTEELREKGYLGSVVLVAPRAYWGSNGQYIELTPEIAEANMISMDYLDAPHLPLAVAIESGLFDLTPVLKDSAEPKE